MHRPELSRHPDSALLPTASRGALGESAAAGARSYAVNRLIVEIVGFGSLIVLARLLAPAQFGYAAVALVVPQIAEILAYEGFGSYLVRRKEATWGDARAVYAVCLVFGVVMTTLMAAVSPSFHGLFGTKATHLIEIASLSFLIAGPGITPLAMLQRELRFKVLSANEARSTIFGVVVSIVLAAAGAGAASLVIAQLARRLYSTVQAQAAVPVVVPHFNPAEMLHVLRAGALAALGGVLFIGKSNADYLILGARLSAAQVGFYYRAYALGIQYQSKIGLVLLRVAFPSYARASDRADMFKIRKRFARAQMAVTFPLLGVFVATAPLLVPLIFGDRWRAAAEPAQILAITAAVGLITNGTAPMMLATGHNAFLAGSNLIDVVGFSASVYIASGHGLIAVCWAVSGFNVLFAVAQTFYFIRIKLGQPSGELWLEAFGPLSCALPAMVLGLVLLPHRTAAAASALLIVLTTLVGFASYVVLYRLVYPANWTDVSTMARRFLPSRKFAARNV